MRTAIQRIERNDNSASKPSGYLAPETYDRLRFFKGEAKRQKELRRAAETETADVKEQMRVQHLGIDAMFLTYYAMPMASRTRKNLRSGIQIRMGLVDPLFEAWEKKMFAEIAERNPGGV